MIDDSTLELLRERAEAATPGPYHHSVYEVLATRSWGEEIIARVVERSNDTPDATQRFNNGEAIASALNAVPALVDRVRELQVALDEAFERGDGWRKLYDEDTDKQAALVDRVRELEGALGAARRQHYYCDDCWYSCPKAPDGCCDDTQGDACNCGADDFNARIDALLGSTGD